MTIPRYIFLLQQTIENPKRRAIRKATRKLLCKKTLSVPKILHLNAAYGSASRPQFLWY